MDAAVTAALYCSTDMAIPGFLRGRPRPLVVVAGMAGANVVVAGAGTIVAAATATDVDMFEFGNCLIDGSCIQAKILRVDPSILYPHLIP